MKKLFSLVCVLAVSMFVLGCAEEKKPVAPKAPTTVEKKDEVKKEEVKKDGVAPAPAPEAKKEGEEKKAPEEKK